MKRSIVAILILLTAASCQSRKAREFDTLLDSTERKAFRILMADSMEKDRLTALIDKKPDVALSIAQTQSDMMNKLIDTISQTNVADLKNGDELKQKAIAYYKTLLRLKDMDMQEARGMAITFYNDTAKTKKPETDMLQLTRKRMEVHRIIATADQARYQAQTKFKEANGIK